MAQIVLENLCKVFKGAKGETVRTVDSVSMTIENGEFMVLVGPSGCGKSTTLRMIAGLEEVSSGSIWIDGRVVNQVEPKDRDVAMVFQNYALYPHMSVYENMAFGLKLRKVPKSEIERRVADAAATLGLSELLDRLPKALSGGQRQRVAVGRAIVRQPRAFLFDEPLSNLDARMRVQMRMEISRLHQRLGATMVYVTHDQVEAMTMGDRIAVMKNGVVQQIADPTNIYHKPSNLFVAGFMGAPPMNIFRGLLRGSGGDLVFEAEKTSSTSADGEFQLRLARDVARRVESYTGKTVILGARPENLTLRSDTSEAADTGSLNATVELVEPLGSETFVHLVHGSVPFVVRLDRMQRLVVGEKCSATIDAAKVHFFDPGTERAIG
jgi:multiple sugar transport system ATP-binding protein